MTPHVPDIITSPDAAGRFRAKCLACMEGSTPSFHRGIAEQWKKDHIKAAMKPAPFRPDNPVETS